MSLTNAMNVNDGQVASGSAATLFSLTTNAPANGAWAQGRFEVTFVNNNAAQQTVVVSFTRGGQTNSRNIAHFTLAQNEQATLGGIGIGQGDVLSGVTTTSSAVDFTVRSSTQSEMTLSVQDANGAYKQVNSGVSGAQTVSGRLTANLLAVGPAASDTYSSAMTIDVTKSSHIISAVNGTSATSTFTPSAAGSAGDLLYIITEADASGTVTVTFASTFHSSGTQATTASHFSSIVFQSDGTRWVEICRTTALA